MADYAKALFTVLIGFLPACVPSIRSRPGTEATREPPAPPTARRTASAMVANAPLAGPGAPAPPAGDDERVVEGHWHWNGVEWKWVPAYVEKKGSRFDWKRQN